MVRKTIIRTKLKEIEESIKLVEENTPESFEEFSRLGLVKDGIYKRLEFSIENIFDICSILNSDLKLGVPSEDEDIFDNLLRENIIDEKLGEKLRSMKAFRNILVHRYGKIDDKIAFNILKKHLPDFYDFMEKIEKLLEEIP